MFALVCTIVLHFKTSSLTQKYQNVTSSTDRTAFADNYKNIELRMNTDCRESNYGKIVLKEAKTPP